MNGDDDQKGAFRFPHHRLRVWHDAVLLVQLVHRRPIGDAKLRDEAHRASVSVGANIAEGAALEGGAKKRHFRIARGSVVEVVGAYELAEATGEKVPVEDVRELGSGIYAMLCGLVR